MKSVPERKEEAENVLRLAVDNRGKGPPPVEDWLTPLPEGTEFLYKRRKMGTVSWNHILSHSQKLSQTDKSTFLDEEIGSGWGGKKWVDTAVFVENFELWEILE